MNLPAIFLSYRSTSFPLASRVHKAILQNQGLVWADWATIGISADWQLEVARSLPSYDVLLAVGDASYRASENCTYEWSFAGYAGLHRFRLEDVLQDYRYATCFHELTRTSGECGSILYSVVGLVVKRP